MSPPAKAREPLLLCVIRNVRARQCLWNRRHADHHNAILRSMYWMEVLTNLKRNFSYDELVEHRLDSIANVKRAWKHTIDTFSRKWKEEVKPKDQSEAKEASKDVPEKKEWPFYQPLRFLESNYDPKAPLAEISEDESCNNNQDDNSEAITSTARTVLPPMNAFQRKAILKRESSSSADIFRLRWNDHESNVMSALRQLRDDEDFFDVSFTTVDSCGRVLHAHKVILASCSNYFKLVLRGQSKKGCHTDLMLLLKGVKYTDLQNVLNFIYNGEVRIPQCQIASFLSLAEDLQIKGLTHEKATKIREATLKRPLPLKKSEGSSAKVPRPSEPVPSEPTRNPSTAPKVVQPEETEQNEFSLENYIQEINESEGDNTNDQADEQEERFQDYGGIGIPANGQVFNPSELIKVLPCDDSKPKAECIACHMIFKSPANCRVHVVRAHGPPVFFQCKLCEKVIKGSNMFRNHAQKKHGVRGVNILETYAKIPDETAITASL